MRVRAIALLFALICAIALPASFPPCLRPYAVLAARAPEAFAHQQKSVHRVSDDRVVEEYHAPESGEPQDLHPRAVQGLLTANQRFVQTRGAAIAPDHVFQKQKTVTPRNTRYFVLSERGETKVARGFGMLIDGTDGDKLPVENEFQNLDLRRQGGQPVQLMEVARLGIAEHERGGLRLLFAGMARHLAEKYGGADHVPVDLRMVLWTTQQGLTDRYRETYGFEELAHPAADRWVMSMTGRDFIRAFAP